MNWRRGLLLAGIHLAVAGSLITWQESREWQYLHSDASPTQNPTLRLAAWQEEQGVGFDPCNGGFVCYGPRPQYYVVYSANIPVAAISGWNEPCPASWSLAGLMNARFGRYTRKGEASVAVSLCLLIFLQWFLIGSFPLIRPRQWWWEPGAFITLCTLTAFVLVLVPGIREIAPFVMLFALLAWLFWLCLLLWKGLKLGWRLTARRVANAQ